MRPEEAFLTAVAQWKFPTGADPQCPGWVTASGKAAAEAVGIASILTARLGGSEFSLFHPFVMLSE